MLSVAWGQVLGVSLLWLAATGHWGGCAPAPAHGARVTHVVTIKGFQFQPMVDTVHVGDSVSWRNQDIVPHTATSDVRRFDSGTIPAQASWRFVPRKRGRVAYHCTFHPTMKGMLVIR